MNSSSSPTLTGAGCLTSSLGLAALAVTVFGLRHAVIDFARSLPALPGIAAGITHFTSLLIRSAAANATLEGAMVLLAAGLYLLYLAGQE